MKFSVPFLLLLASFVAGMAAQCPTTCTTSPGSQIFFALPDSSSVGPLNLTQCQNFCQGKSYYQLILPGVCTCYFSCPSVVTVPIGTIYLGQLARCSPPTPPACPTTCPSTSNIGFGISRTDPSHFAFFPGLASPAVCANLCWGQSAVVGLPFQFPIYFQFAVASNASGFNTGDCDCYAGCNAANYVDFSPQAFVSGPACACANQCPASSPVATLPVTCSFGGNCTTDGVRTQQVNCEICNYGSSVANNVQLTCQNFAPLEVSGVTPGCLVPGAIWPTKCKSFYYKTITGLASISVQQTILVNPYPRSTITVIPATGSVFLACSPPSPFELYPYIYFSFQCTISNNGNTDVTNIILNTVNFDPVAVDGGLNADGTITKVIPAKSTCKISFQAQPGDITLQIASLWTL